MGRLTRLAKDERGATAIEYGLIISMIVLVMLVAFSALANNTGGHWGDVADKVTNA